MPRLPLCRRIKHRERATTGNWRQNHRRAPHTALGLLPAGLNVRELDPALRSNYLLQTRQAPLDLVASNSFGFGGSNACLLFAGPEWAA